MTVRSRVRVRVRVIVRVRYKVMALVWVRRVQFRLGEHLSQRPRWA